MSDFNLNDLDEYSREQIDNISREATDAIAATETLLQALVLVKICRTEDFYNNKIVYDELYQWVMAMFNNTKCARRALAVIEHLKERNCHESAKTAD